jgi:hypothetical protein
MANNTEKYLPPSLDYRIPNIADDDDLRNIRRIIYFLNNQANTRTVADEIIGRLSLVKDENNEYIFTDMRESAPHVVLAKQLAHIGSMVNFMAANVPLLIEDYIISLMGEDVIQGLPEFVWVIYRLSGPLDFDFTIPAGRKLKTESGKLYSTVYDLIIPKLSIGNETDESNNYLYMQLCRSEVTGSAQRVAPRELNMVEGSIAYVDEVYNPDSSFGGRDAERYPDYRIRVFQAPVDNLMITPADYIREIRRFLGPRARAIVIGNDRMSDRTLLNKVRVSVVDPGGTPLIPGTPAALRLLTFLEDKDPNADTVIVAPVITEVRVRLSVTLESLSKDEFEDVKTSIKTAVRYYSNPINWEDWGEQENNLTADKIISYIRKEITGLDHLSVSQMIVGNGTYTQSFPVVRLEPVIGIPNIIIDDITIDREEF